MSEKYREEDALLFSKQEDGFVYKWRGDNTNFIERSRCAPHVEIKNDTVSSYLCLLGTESGSTGCQVERRCIPVL